MISTMSLSIRTYHTIAQFLQDAAPFLRPFALENNRILGACTVHATIPDAVMPLTIVVLEELKVKGVAMLADSVLLLGYRSTPDAMHAMANYLFEHDTPVNSVMATTDEAQLFAQAFAKPLLRERDFLLYGAEALHRIDRVEGNSRIANESDLPILDNWLEQFFVEAQLYPPKPRQQLEVLNRRKLQLRQIMVWEVNGSPVSTSAIIRTTPDVAIVGHVYTPETLRGKGYSAASVHALCNEFHKRGHDKFGLFVDEHNHAARKVYERIGFSLRQHCRHIIFT